MKMKNDEFSKMLEKRTRQFALSVLKLSLQINGETSAEGVKDDLIRSGVSVGANYWKAFRSENEESYMDNIILCERDARESIRCLTCLAELQLTDQQDLAFLTLEAEDLQEMFEALMEEGKEENT